MVNNCVCRPARPGQVCRVLSDLCSVPPVFCRDVLCGHPRACSVFYISFDPDPGREDLLAALSNVNINDSIIS